MLLQMSTFKMIEVNVREIVFDFDSEVFNLGDTYQKTLLPEGHALSAKSSALLLADKDFAQYVVPQ
jgi:hypothetical protein